MSQMTICQNDHSKQLDGRKIGRTSHEIIELCCREINELLLIFFVSADKKQAIRATR